LNKTNYISALVIIAITAVFVVSSTKQANAQEVKSLWTGDWVCTSTTDSDRAIGVDGKSLISLTINTYPTIIALDINITETDNDGTLYGTEFVNVEGTSEMFSQYILLSYKFTATHPGPPVISTTMEYMTKCIGVNKDDKGGVLNVNAEMECLGQAKNSNKGDFPFTMHCQRDYRR
jgi:hypothetical protein